LRLDRLSKADNGRPPAEAELLDRVKNDLKEAVAASRSLAVELSPPALHESGLPAAVSWLSGWMTEKYGLIVDLTADPDAAPARKDIRTLVFESVRELLFNVVKHAKVERVTVDLALTTDDAIRITVTDTGVGFDPAAKVSQANSYQAGLGLFSIRERLALLGGRLEVESAPGQGTRFTLTAPRLGIERRSAATAHASLGEAEGIA
jgi:signal transduction histidine kinase